MAEKNNSPTSPPNTNVRRKLSAGNSTGNVNAVLDAFDKLVVSTSSTPIRGTAVSLSIPLDGASQTVVKRVQEHGDEDEAKVVLQATPKRQLRRRDSLDRREALLKGKEGSRRRQKWENDRLLDNPYVQPPLPMDWEVRPVYPVRVVPYALAALWDARQEEQQRRAARRSSAIKEAMTKKETLVTAGHVPRSLRAKLKRSNGAKGLLQELEEEVRKFVQAWKDAEEKRHRRESVAVDDEDDEDDFVLVRPESSHSTTTDGYIDLGDLPIREKLVFHSFEDDPTAGFCRYLIHELGRYYNLDTYSVTTGRPARREAYVAIKFDKSRDKAPPLPRPLYCMV